jgi:hypothetical protein
LYPQKFNTGIRLMRREKLKISKEENLPDDQPILDETPAAVKNDDDSIQDFIELKRLQNRILEKLIDQISPSKKKKTNINKTDKL